MTSLLTENHLALCMPLTQGLHCSHVRQHWCAVGSSRAPKIQAWLDRQWCPALSAYWHTHYACLSVGYTKWGSEMSSGAAIDNTTSSQSQAPDFFAGLSARRQRANSPQDTKKEVDSYLADTADNLESLNAYPHVRQLYISLGCHLVQQLKGCLRWEGGYCVPPFPTKQWTFWNDDIFACSEVVA